MKFLIIFFLCLIIILIVWHFITLKYLNPYTMDLYIANKGAGKSCTLSKNVLKYIKSGKPVYTNADDINISGTRIFNTYDLGYYFVEDSYILIDEVSLFFDNRNALNKKYMQQSKDFVQWLRECRHDRLCIDLFTQSYDCDKKIRTMCDNIYIGTRYFRVLTIWRRLRKNVAIKDSALDAESQIVDALKFTPWWIPGSIKVTYIPKYIKYFDSFKALKVYQGNLSYKTVNNEK